MWRNYVQQAFRRTRPCRRLLISQSSSRSFPGKSQASDFPNDVKFRPFDSITSSICDSSCNSGIGRLRRTPIRWYANAAEAVSSSSSDEVSADEEFRESREMIEEEVVKRPVGRAYEALKRRQVKLETEVWEKASSEYKQMVDEMCRQKLAPNLPYMKSLFLGWFEPLRDAIREEQKLCLEGKCRNLYAPYFVQLPAEMMAVITMHKLMGLLMTKEGQGFTRVVHASIAIGEAIEQEV